MSIIDQTGYVKSLAIGLKDAVVQHKQNEKPDIQSARKVCMQARKLFSGFEQEAIWDDAIEEAARETVLVALVEAEAALVDFNSHVLEQDRLTYLRIMVSMSERVHIVRISTAKTIREYLRAFATDFVAKEKRGKDSTVSQDDVA